MSPHTTLTRIGSNPQRVTNRIVRTFDEAGPWALQSGAAWYADAGALADHLASQSVFTRVQVAAAIAALSPRLSWRRNVSAATELVLTGERPNGVIGRSYAQACTCLLSESPLEILTGPKTRSFAANILGDLETVTVDVWAARIADVTERMLARSGVYAAVEHCYRLAARRREISPAVMQATTWCVARGRAA